MSEERRRVLITGATSGLGREMALQLARRGCRLALTGRRERELDEAARAVGEVGGEALSLVGSVTEPETVGRHYAAIRERWGGLDWAVLNAGVGDSKNAFEFSAENYRWTFDVNVMGAVHWMEAVLPDMISARQGTIAGIASLAAFRGLPNSGPYCASKAALVALLESTRVELRGTGVEVVIVCPGFIRSELTDRNDPAKMPVLLETEDGVRRILRGIERRRRMVLFPWQLSIPMWYVIRNLPGWVYDRLVRPMGKYRKRPHR